MGLELQFTDKEITPWGGKALMKRMLDCMNMASALSGLAWPQPGSNRGYRPEQLVQQFMLSVWCGANRFEHGEVTRHDSVLRRLFGWSRMANFKTVMRLFRKLDQSANDRMFGDWYGWLFKNLHIDCVTLDLDSTIMTRYGNQQGAARGYNPQKPGRASHHPLMALIADTQMVANLWLRPGNTHSANNAYAFLDNTLARLANKRVGLLRADSGFSEATFLDHVEQKNISYVIAVRMQQPLQRALVAHTGWWSVNEPGAQGIEIASLTYQSSAWEYPRKVIAVRQSTRLRETARGKTLSLFADDPCHGQYRYAAYVTNLDLPALAIWRLYRGRANCENRIKELKYDFAADSFCLREFFATEACLNVVMMAYNLMSLFRQTLLKTNTHQTLKTLRYKLFGLAGYITNEGRKNILKLALAMKRRAWLAGLWEQSQNIELPVNFSPIFTP